MARQFNGINQSLQSASTIDLSAFNKLAITFWLWWDAFADNDQIALELTANYNLSALGFLIDPNSSFYPGLFEVHLNGNVGFASGTIARPTSGTWHHYVVHLDKSKATAEVDSVYLDGVLQAGTTQNNSNNTNTFGNEMLNVMARNNASLWAAGRMAELAIYGGILLSQSDVTQLASGALPSSVQSASLKYYWPLRGQNAPEPATIGGTALTVNGATAVAHPPALSGGLAGLLDDGVVYPPPATGAFAYNSFVPASPIGSIYTDPVFGATVRRVSNDRLDDTIYARNMGWNADETRYSHWTQIINVVSNTVEYTGVPLGSQSTCVGFDPADPNLYYYYSNSITTQLRKITLQAGGDLSNDVLFFTAPSTLLDLGGTLNWWDASGRYFVVRYGGEPSVRLYDKQNINAGPYANPIDGTNIFGPGHYVGITPDAKYLVAYMAGIGLNGHAGVSWAINHGTRTVAATPVEFWSLSGDHGTFLSASDGRNYMIVFNSYDQAEVWRVDITNNAAGLGFAAQKTLPNNVRLLQLDFSETGHFSAVATGALRDWAFLSMEDASDTFGGGVSPWRIHKQEIIALNVLTGEVRRLAHHRSRSIGADYFHQPRLSASWKGKYIGWASNFNVNAANNVDIFAVQFDLGTVAPLPTVSESLTVAEFVLVVLGAPTTTRTSTIQFTWNANTEPDLAGYRLYAGRASGVYNATGSPKSIGVATTGSFTINDSGLWYFALTAVDLANQESAKSAEVSRNWLLLGNF